MVESRVDDDEGLIITTFRVRADGAHHACVVGEFNEWSSSANPMEREGDSFVARIALKPGRAYRFRYLLDGERWENDWTADAYVPNEFGGDDSVVDLSVASTPPAAPDGGGDKPVAKRTRKPRRAPRAAKT